MEPPDPNDSSSLRDEVSHDMNTPIDFHDVPFIDFASLPYLSDALLVDDIAVFSNNASQFHTLDLPVEDPSEEFSGTAKQFMDCLPEEFFRDPMSSERCSIIYETGSVIVPSSSGPDINGEQCYNNVEKCRVVNKNEKKSPQCSWEAYCCIDGYRSNVLFCPISIGQEIWCLG